MRSSIVVGILAVIGSTRRHGDDADFGESDGKYSHHERQPDRAVRAF